MSAPAQPKPTPRIGLPETHGGRPAARRGANPAEPADPGRALDVLVLALLAVGILLIVSGAGILLGTGPAFITAGTALVTVAAVYLRGTR